MEFFLTTKDHAVTKESFELQYNANLEMLHTVPRPKEIDKYYQDENYVSHTDGNRTVLEKIYQLVKKFNLKKKESWIKKYTKKNAEVLDVGAGTGSLVKFLKERGWASDGVEPNSKARSVAKVKGIELKATLNDLGDKKYDLITLWHVLEHVPDLEKNIQEIKNRLTDDGVLFIAVPNFRSYDATHYGSFWAAYDVPRHLWHFSQKSIQRIFSNNGFSLVTTKPMIFDAFYIAQLSEKYRHGKHRFLAAFWHGLRSNYHGWRSGEYSSLLYVLEKR
ncbi:class I SAM-dependent methyltransferase [uncultured Muriicola sp.]|uniref:class I SAM-dependent methyltransferase n=1 Tax=uncultured Muriicola sp. TaxID=1583102 RepID=UPI0026217004|nr:class I SAM-dependent methyltransferase [uncultured Muriicola sp.]